MSRIKAIEFTETQLNLIDQRKLPRTLEIFPCRTYGEADFAIRDMVVRGAPAIGATAAYGVVLAAQEFAALTDLDDRQARMETACAVLNESRPTAVNLMWAIKRMRAVIAGVSRADGDVFLKAIREEADVIYNETRDLNLKLCDHGAELIPPRATLLTHCNTGALATVDYGTALGVISRAHEKGKEIFVYADETRPRNQGGRLTAWELLQEGIPSKLIVDSTAATLIRDGKIDAILVGADRIARNGDTANKIGTFMLSVVAKAYGVPFYVAAPISTIDFEMADGSEIEIEERAPEEITHLEGIRIAPEGVQVYNPAFDVTPAENITGIITEKGVVTPSEEAIAALQDN